MGSPAEKDASRARSGSASADRPCFRSNRPDPPAHPAASATDGAHSLPTPQPTGARTIALGLSQNALARRANLLAGLASGGLTRTEIKRYEHGGRRPVDWLPFIAGALGMSSDELTGVTDPIDAVLADLEVDVGMAIDRRTFLTDSGGLALSALPVSPNSPVPPEAVDYFRDRLDGHWREDAVQGPRHRATVTAQFKVLEHVAGRATGSVRRELWQTAAAWSGLATWLCQDAGQMSRAAAWSVRTLELSHRAHDAQLVAHALANRAMLDTDIGDGPTTVEMATAALEGNGLCAKVRVQALQQAAHGHALLGDRAAVDHALDSALPLIDQMDDPYGWGNAPHTSSYLEIQRATCYTRLGLGAEAVRLWDQVQGSASRRNSGVFTARYARSLAAARRPEEAVIALEAAIEVVAEVESARLRREVRTAAAALSPWQHDGPGRRAHELLGSIGLTAHE
ncbi:helix-turn-helix domain-containing protein [Streptomyces daliensis]